MINLNTIKKYLSTNDISFLVDFDKTIEIDKTGKSYYYKSFEIKLDSVTKFICNLEDEAIYLINPSISVNCKYSDPYLTLSRQFLISNNSNPVLITNYLINQLEIAQNDFNFDLKNYILLLKYKKVYLDHRIIK